MTTAIVGATLIDGTGRDPVPNATLIIDEHGRIERVGGGIEPPRDATVIDAAGAHAHARDDRLPRASLRTGRPTAGAPAHAAEPVAVLRRP